MLIDHLLVVQEYLSDDLGSDTEDEKQMRVAEKRVLAKKKRVKQKSVTSVTITKPLHAVDRSHNFRLNSSFSLGGLASPHSNNSHQTSQSIFTTDSANRNAVAELLG